MTERELRELVTLWQRRLGLSQWEIQIKIEAIDGEAYAEVDRQTDYDRALIRFQPWFLTAELPPEPMIQLEITDEWRERTVVHELLHCWTRDYRGVLEDYVDGQIHRDAYDLLGQAVKSVEEKTIDRLARSLVTSFGVTTKEQRSWLS